MNIWVIGVVIIKNNTDKSEGNKKYVIEINKITYGGDGIGYLPSGKIVFVPKTITGEKHLVKITKVKKSYAHGKSIKRLKDSQFRIEPKCEIFEECGGCQWQHIRYKKQKEFKEDILRESLDRIGKFDEINVESIKGVDHPWFYRNKSVIPFQKNEEGEIIAGFYKRGTHQVVDNHTCYIQHQLINRIKRYTLKLLNNYGSISVYDEHQLTGLLRHLHIRVGVCTNQVLLTFITTGREFQELDEIAKLLMEEIPELKGIVRNINDKDTNLVVGNKSYLIKGEDYIYDFIGKRKYKITQDSFFQINTLQTKKLYDTVQEYINLSGNEVIVDAYSGIGSIALYLNDNYRKVIGIESNKKAVEDSLHNASMNDLENCRFIQGDVTEEIPNLINNDNKPDVLIFDPPRSGLNEEIINTVINQNIEEIIYVSCDPTTLARDLKKFEKFYNIRRIQPVDMFPQTYHIETVVKLRREF
ncbi:MAG: 23S rRNA (uracil(1939)-C(5))-methyltransferase RlmD [Halanaerobiales bacterium]